MPDLETICGQVRGQHRSEVPLVVHNSNPAVICPDQNRVIDGLERDDLFTVVLEQFMTDVRENMEREAQQKVKNDIREQVMDSLLATNPLDIPQTLVHQEAHSLQHDAMRRMGIEDHDQAPPIETFSEAAEKRVRLGLLLRQVIADNGLKADAARLREHVEEMCASYENADEMVEMYLGNPQLMQQIEPVVVEQLAVEWLLENGKVKAKKIAFKDYMNAPAS